MGRVAQQRDAPDAPAAQRRAVVDVVVQNGGLVGRLDQRLDRRVPAAEPLQQRGLAVALGRARPRRAVERGEPVDPPAAHGRDAEARAAAPDLAGRRAGARWVELHHRAPGAVAGVARPLAAEQLRPHGRAQPVGADQQVAARLLAIRKVRRDPACALAEADQLGAQPDLRGAQLLAQDRQQLGAVDHQAQRRRAGAAVQRRQVDQRLAAPRAQRPAEIRHGLGLDFVGQPEPAERVDRVLPDRQARADLAQLAGALVDRGVDPSLPQRDRRREAADPTADDDRPDRVLLLHVRALYCLAHVDDSL